ncbi:MAG TPA: DUF892 family protein [Ktedonobacterales bacterium]|jgi:ferritin-like metal-binding protein YciE|nr:DUF892 family protein [Ktedonobacterales bacterium]
MPMTSPSDLFLHELGDIYDEENRLLQILPALASEVDNQQVKQAFQQHLQETQQQVKNIEQVFQLMGQQPKRETCAAIQGLKQEHDTFMKQESPSPQITTMFDLGAAAKTEHYEIASYEGLIAACQLMGQQDCAQLLRQNLQQEQAMAQRVSQLSKQLGQQMIGAMSGQADQMQTGQQTTTGL